MRDDAKSGALTEVTFLILLALYRPRHGYAIMQEIDSRTNGRVVLGAGTLYGALNALQKKGWIEPLNGGIKCGRKKEFIITQNGKETAEKELKRLKRLTDFASRIVEEKTAW